MSMSTLPTELANIIEEFARSRSTFELFQECLAVVNATDWAAIGITKEFYMTRIMGQPNYNINIQSLELNDLEKKRFATAQKFMRWANI